MNEMGNGPSETAVAESVPECAPEAMPESSFEGSETATESLAEQYGGETSVDEIPPAPEIEESSPELYESADEIPEPLPAEATPELNDEAAEYEDEIPEAPAVEQAEVRESDASAENNETTDEIPDSPPVEASAEWDSGDDREYRKQSLREESRVNKIDDTREQIESGIWSEDTEALEREVGRDGVVNLVEGNAGLNDLGLDVHHKVGLDELGASAADPQYSEILTKKKHVFEAHGGDTTVPTDGVHRKDFSESTGFSGDRQRGVPPLENVDQEMDDQSMRDWPSVEDQMNETLDAARHGSAEDASDE